MTHYSGADVQQLWQIARLFLKLGMIGFGGPAAHIAMMEDEVVRRRRWLSREEFLDLLGATNLIPGPNSTEMAIHIGHRQGGPLGLVVAGVCFILPAMILVMGCAWGYVRYGKLPEVEAILYGIKPVIIAIVIQALWNLSRQALKTPKLMIAAACVATLSFQRVNELILLLGAGLGMMMLMLLLLRGKFASQIAGVPPPTPVFQPIFTTALSISGAAASPISFGLWPLFLFFLKTGSVLYGSGYVLLAFLRGGLVERFGWLTEGQLLDAIVIGQITPGPVFTTATFIGYLLGGIPAAIVATIGIFLPAFFFVAISGPLVPWIRRSRLAGAFLDGVNAASLALMGVVTWQLGAAAISDWITVLLTAASAFLLFCFNVNSGWLVAGGALVGVLKKLGS